MTPDPPPTANLQAALDWLRAIIISRLQAEAATPAQPAISPGHDGLSRLIQRFHPDHAELAVLMLALAPSLLPDIFTRLIAEHLPEGGDFPEFGGVRGASHRGLLPTGETAQFILAGDDLEKRLEVQRLFSSDHWFARERILWLEPVPAGEPVMSGRITLAPEVVEELTLGAVSRPRFSSDFPAEYIGTGMDWDDLVLHPDTLRQIREIGHWLEHNGTLLHDWGMRKRLKPGYRALFHGPPGTGKTLTAALLGKQTGQDVFRIDLSRVVSKYIGETEKNLASLFDKAEHKDWILFFDEADALFGKRTDIRDAHDKYANQEVAYLLQRIENCNGLIVLASNQRANIDEAFVRRFQSIIHFPLPRPEERLQLWRKTFPPQIPLADDIDWRQIAARHELSGASILNITHYCAIETLANGHACLDLKRLETAILREYVKEGKAI